MASASTIELARLRRPPPLALRFFTEERLPQSPNDNNDPFPVSTSYEDESIALHPLWKRQLYQLLEQPTSSTSAFVIQMFSTFLIVFSALVTVLETVPAVHSISTKVWFGVETSVVALFTVEYIARCVAWSTTWMSLFRWVISFYGVIDLLSVLPYYLEVMFLQDTSVYFRFSILRMFRLLRVFRPFRYNHTILLTIEVMYLSVRRSQHALLAIGFFVIMILTVFSTLLYFAERGTWDELLGTFINADGDPTQFSSIPAAAWFVLVTITTVGYGEITPRSFLGRLITLPILVFGLLLITLPSFVLGREFSHVWEKMNSDRKEEEDAGAGGNRGGGGSRSASGLPSAPAGSRSARPPRSSRILRTAAEDTDDPYGPSSFHYSPAGYSSRRPDWERPFGDPGGGGGVAARDLSNMKLAQNQTELSRQIEELAGTMEVQGRLLRRLLEKLDSSSGSAMSSGEVGGGLDSKVDGDAS